MKAKTSYVCSGCGHTESRWLGRCPACGQWNTLLPASASRSPTDPGRGRRAPLSLENVDPERGSRLATGIGEFDRVLGGGLMSGSAVLVGGEPGIGKSTLMLQSAAVFGRARRVLYVSGEESPAQIRVRAERLGLPLKGLSVLADTELASVVAALDDFKPEVTVVDSIQTLYSPELGAVPGTANQVRYCCHELAERVRERGGAILLVAHVTKEGTIAGPKLVEHLVDTVLYFEQNGAEMRFLRASKNRFGSTDEIGIFTMSEQGLAPVADPSELFRVARGAELPAGVATAPVYEGSRVLMVEIQALTVTAKGGMSRVYSDRIDQGRVSRVAAVIEKHLGLRFSDQDIYVNVAGGMRIGEVGIELPLAAALYSARSGLIVPAGCCVTGELTLAGEVRPILHLRRRLRTAAELGFDAFVGPAGVREGDDGPETWTKVSTLAACVEAVFGKRKTP